MGCTVDITKELNIDSTTLAAIEYTLEGRAKAYDVCDENCRNTNYQFYDRYANSSDSDKTVYLIDKANSPSTTRYPLPV